MSICKVGRGREVYRRRHVRKSTREIRMFALWNPNEAISDCVSQARINHYMLIQGDPNRNFSFFKS